MTAKERERREIYGHIFDGSSESENGTVSEKKIGGRDV